MSEMSIYDKLIEVQSRVKCGKGETVDFTAGSKRTHYSYRTAEQVLEAAKPALKEVRAAIICTDELAERGGLNYVKATAIFTDGTGSIQAVAYAREDQSLGGQSGGQISGSTSSYARKYALCGLLAIDANRDLDSQEMKNAENMTPEEAKKVQVKNKKGVMVDMDTLNEQGLEWVLTSDGYTAEQVAAADILLDILHHGTRS